MKQLIIYSLIFVAVGELFLRFDEHFGILQAQRVVKIATDIELTPEFQQIQNGSFRVEETDLRVLVIGDSYIHGGGIDFNDNFSQQLKNMLASEQLAQDDVWVLDASQPSSNTLDNNLTYFQFADKFKPQFVVLGHNINDVEGNLNKALVSEDTSAKAPDERQISGGEALSTIRKIYRIVYQSKFLQFTLHNIHKNLKINGIVIPNSRFDYILKSYSTDKENWKQSKKLLEEIIADANARGIQLIVFQFPETNLLEHAELFSEAYESIERFFLKHPDVAYQNGHELFKGKKSSEFVLSKYDGHPNEKAHHEIAKYVYSLIRNIRLQHNEARNQLAEKLAY
jgi:hypothetical protein